MSYIILFIFPSCCTEMCLNLVWNIPKEGCIPSSKMVIAIKITRRTTGARGYKFELFQSNFQLYKTIFLVYLVLSRFILVYFELFWTILVYLGASRCILVYLGLTRSISVYLGSSQSIWDYLGLYWTIWDYLGLFGTIWDYLGLPRTISWNFFIILTWAIPRGARTPRNLNLTKVIRKWKGKHPICQKILQRAENSTWSW